MRPAPALCRGFRPLRPASPPPRGREGACFGLQQQARPDDVYYDVYIRDRDHGAGDPGGEEYGAAGDDLLHDDRGLPRQRQLRYQFKVEDQRHGRAVRDERRRVEQPPSPAVPRRRPAWTAGAGNGEVSAEVDGERHGEGACCNGGVPGLPVRRTRGPHIEAAGHPMLHLRGRLPRQRHAYDFRYAPPTWRGTAPRTTPRRPGPCRRSGRHRQGSVRRTGDGRRSDVDVEQEYPRPNVSSLVVCKTSTSSTWTRVRGPAHVVLHLRRRLLGNGTTCNFAGEDNSDLTDDSARERRRLDQSPCRPFPQRMTYVSDQLQRNQPVNLSSTQEQRRWRALLDGSRTAE